MIDKASLRRELRAARRMFVAGLAAGERARLEAALRDAVLRRLPSDGILGVYAAIGDEIDPRPIVEALPPGRVALPAFTDRGSPMTFRRLGAALERGPFGVLQPGAEAASVLPDMLLVPLVGADMHRRRIGQGAGHYDRYLAERSLPTIGLGWDVQIVEEIPADPWDVPLDAIATPTRWIVARGDGAATLG